MRGVSETSKCRARLEQFCVGTGVDVGHGGDLIAPHAIGVDLPRPYTRVGKDVTHLAGDGRCLSWFRDGVLDFVYSSHLLEDFKEPLDVLRDWCRTLKVGGVLILYCPDEVKYREECHKHGFSPNQNHAWEEFNLGTVKTVMSSIDGMEVVYENPHVDVYSWEAVWRKMR